MLCALLLPPEPGSWEPFPVSIAFQSPLLLSISASSPNPLSLDYVSRVNSVQECHAKTSNIFLLLGVKA